MTAAPLTPRRWREIEPILDGALDLPLAAREPFVARACADDPALRAEVLALLDACRRAGEMLNEPAVVAYDRLLTREPEPPRVIGGRYHVEAEIARGGMGVVYRARDARLDRPVAVKVLHGHVARLVGREGFEREVRFAARLSHPHILPLHDCGEVAEGGAHGAPLLYHVSPFVDGESLRERLARGPRLSEPSIVRLGTELAYALDYAHRQGVVHLDVKPENVLLQDGHAVLADFGIARAVSLAPAPAALDAGPLLGTPAYMSPEHARGARDLDGRSDVFSLGCVLYEMITGIPPFARAGKDGASPPRRPAAVPDPGPLRAAAAPPLAGVVMRAMAVDREARFRTAAELAHALGGARAADVRFAAGSAF